MIQTVYGIREFQIKLPHIARTIADFGGHILVTNRSKPSLVAIPFEDYQEIVDIFMELNAPRLKKDIAEGRQDYKTGKTKDFNQFLKEFND